jgi:two-component system, NtrC family, sensor kinase
MKLTRKLTVALACAILVVLGLDAALEVDRKATVFERSIQRDTELLARTIAASAGRVWQTAGETQARDLVENANERNDEVIIRWVSFEAPAGSDKSPAVPVDLIGPLWPDRTRTVSWRAPGEAEDSLYTYQLIEIPLAGRAIEVRESLEPASEYVRHTVLRGAITTAILVSLCAGVAMVIGVFFVGRPVRRLVEQARRVGGGDLSARLELAQRDEIGQLAGEMNAMCDRLAETRERLEAETVARLAALDQLRHADRLTTVGKLASGLAHEIGTPLNVITGYAQLITDEYPAQDGAHRNAAIIAQQAERVAAIIRQLLDFARRRSPNPTRQDLGALARETTSLLGSLAHKHHVTIELDIPEEPVWVRADGGQMKQALINLVVNGIQSMPEGGSLTVAVDLQRAQPPADHGGAAGSFACLEVRDRGQGIAASDLPRVFEPFFTTKEVGEGTGLGLSVSYGIVREHGGWIEAHSAPGAGSRFGIYLPPEVAG